MSDRKLDAGTEGSAAAGTGRSLDSGASEDGDAFRGVGWQGVLLIFGFWTFFGIVMAASLLLSPLRQGAAAPAALLVFTFLGAYTWAALTLPLLSLTRRLDLIRDDPSRRFLRFLGLLGFSLVLAGTVSTLLSLVSSILLQDLLGGDLSGTSGFWRMVRYRVLNDLLACHLILTAGVARDYFYRYRARLAEANLLRAQLVEARLEVLRTQLNPHFLFNTLNAVAALVARDPRGVRRMIARLSELLRYTLAGATEAEIPLEQELESLERYLEIMEIRFRNRLETEVSAASEVLDALVPTFILQPLVENAMKHGAGRADGPGRIDVTARRDGPEVVMTVRDTGTGEDEEVVVPDLEGLAEDSGGRGMGLRHTRQRLEQLYGERGSLSLRPLPEGGVSAEVRVPFHLRAVEPPGVPSPTGSPAERDDGAPGQRRRKRKGSSRV